MHAEGSFILSTDKVISNIASYCHAAKFDGHFIKHHNTNMTEQ